MTESAVEPRYVCTVCGQLSDRLGPGPGGRPDAACINCGSLERHRALSLLARILIDRRPADSLVIDLAPTGILSDTLRKYSGGGYVSVDFDPAADSRTVDVQASLTRLPLRPGSVGFLYCSHVLEHIPDDRAAIGEIHRCLHEAGVAIVQVPRRSGAVTDEDPTASRAERIQRFGQSDHVRYYGDDFEARLEEAGLLVASTSYGELYSPEVLNALGAPPEEELWLLTKGIDPWPMLQFGFSDGTLARLVYRDHLPLPAQIQTLDDLAKLELALIGLSAGVEAMTLEAEEWRSRYLWLAGRAPVRLGLAAKRGLRNLVQNVRDGDAIDS